MSLEGVAVGCLLILVRVWYRGYIERLQIKSVHRFLMSGWFVVVMVVDGPRLLADKGGVAHPHPPLSPSPSLSTTFLKHNYGMRITSFVTYFLQDVLDGFLKTGCCSLLLRA